MVWVSSPSVYPCLHACAFLSSASLPSPPFTHKTHRAYQSINQIWQAARLTPSHPQNTPGLSIHQPDMASRPPHPFPPTKHTGPINQPTNQIWQAARILPLLQRRHLLLVTLLLFNSVAAEALPLALDELVPGYVAVRFVL